MADCILWGVFNFHWSGVLTALFACCIDGATWNCCRLSGGSVYTTQPCTSLQCYFIRSRIRKMHVCLPVTCHLHFWQNDRDLVGATAVSPGWKGYRNNYLYNKPCCCWVLSTCLILLQEHELRELIHRRYVTVLEGCAERIQVHYIHFTSAKELLYISRVLDAKIRAGGLETEDIIYVCWARSSRNSSIENVCIIMYPW